MTPEISVVPSVPCALVGARLPSRLVSSAQSSVLSRHVSAWSVLRSVASCVAELCRAFGRAMHAIWDWERSV